MIKIIPTKTKLQENLEYIDDPLSLVENSVRSAINSLNESFNRFWNLSDDEIEAILNYHGYAEMEKIFTAHYTYGMAFNKLLEDRGIDSPRAILVKPREIEMIEGTLVLVPLPEPVVVEPEYIPETED